MPSPFFFAKWTQRCNNTFQGFCTHWCCSIALFVRNNWTSIFLIAPNGASSAFPWTWVSENGDFFSVGISQRFPLVLGKVKLPSRVLSFVFALTKKLSQGDFHIHSSCPNFNSPFSRSIHRCLAGSDSKIAGLSTFMCR